MQTPANIPTCSGVFAVVNTHLKQAYVGKTKNLRTRASMWKHMLDKAEEDKTYNIPIRGIERAPAAEWRFFFWTGGGEDNVREAFERRGIATVNKRARVRMGEIEVDGRKATLEQHAARLGVPIHTAYRRLQRKYTVRQALGLDAIEAFNERDWTIEAMRVKLVSDNGGYLTYDEAESVRPELGNLRNRMARWRKKNPEATEVRLDSL